MLSLRFGFGVGDCGKNTLVLFVVKSLLRVVFTIIMSIIIVLIIIVYLIKIKEVVIK